MENTERGRRRRRGSHWDSCFAAAERYYREHGDLLVPAKYETEDGLKLGSWIGWLRGKYNGMPSAGPSLYADEIVALERIGMVWRLHRRPGWEEWLAQLRLYREEHGDVLVPNGYEQNGFRLGKWVQDLRSDRRTGRLSARQIDDLERLGMPWSADRRREWERYYPAACLYHGAHGHLMVPKDFVTRDGLALGRWLMLQRERRARTSARYRSAAPMPQEEIEALDRIGMVWADLDEVRWRQALHAVADYRKRTGRLPPQRCLEAVPGGPRLGSWVANQRAALKAGKLDEEKRSLLGEIGITAGTEGLA